MRELWREWATIERMERSSAIQSSDLGCRLAHRRGVTYALSQPGGVERFLSEPAEISAVRAVLPAQWSLRAADASSADTIGRTLARPGAYVAKNVLRPRTGSGATQDRAASGGAPVTSADGLRALLRDERAREWYLLFEKLRPLTHEAIVSQPDGATHTIEAAVSELAVYGAYLAVPDEATPRLNVAAGVAARTRPLESSHALASSLGYGALSCIATRT